MTFGDRAARPHYEKLTDSDLWKRLRDETDSEVRAMASKVERVAHEATFILDRVVEYMPLYTLHDERHILNVIGWMERLLGPDGLQRLSPMECALCILSAYAHDLGMTLNREEHAELMKEEGASPVRQEYARFRDRFPDDRFMVEQLRRDGRHYHANLIENHLLSEYLRATHADMAAERMKLRLTEIASAIRDAAIFEYHGFDFREALELIATSHNQPVHWLRAQSRHHLGSFWITVGNGEPVNYGFVGLLLRLADIMDFDASRTPPILFHHIGLDQQLATHFGKEQNSRQEWQKHLAITSVHWPDGGRLMYLAGQCPHPVIEKSIRDFVSSVREEVSNCRMELRRLNNEVDARRCSLLLPEDVVCDVRPERKDGRAIYEYHEWKFELDQVEIARLLMGESLYGNPGVCIRELLQNALDAVELRDLRLQMNKACGKSEQPVDGVSLGPGRFTSTGMEEELSVRLNWGEENAQQFIRVEDNGVGMTEDVIQRYFTRIGKSFYGSSEFRREQADMRNKGLLCTPISQFGIGVLSFFMIAERISVRTHPGGVDNEQRRAIDLEISGPGSLFWTKAGTRGKQGTEVTLWLRNSSGGKPLKLAHEWEICRNELLSHFGYTASRERRSTGLDPGLIAATHIV